MASIWQLQTQIHSLLSQSSQQACAQIDPRCCWNTCPYALGLEVPFFLLDFKLFLKRAVTMPNNCIWVLILQGRMISCASPFDFPCHSNHSECMQIKWIHADQVNACRSSEVLYWAASMFPWLAFIGKSQVMALCSKPHCVTVVKWNHY